MELFLLEYLFYALFISDPSAGRDLLKTVHNLAEGSEIAIKLETLWRQAECSRQSGPT
ncbi:hypothetical protein SBV1_3160007 [Verrucomicrobia bacterium]|nr:hypothetical protein SBV1_3160007 [Verrucomicrobiota bacterium]